MPAVARKIASRVSRDPVKDRTGDVKVVLPKNLSAEDIQSLLICYEHYAPIPYIAALTGRNDNWVRTRLRELKRPPNGYVALAPYQQQHQKQYQSDYQRFVLTKLGRDTLINRGYTLPPKFPRSSSPTHDAFGDDCLLSLKLGLKNHTEISAITAADILGSKNIKAKVRTAEDWHYFPIHAEHTKKTSINPDYFPMGFIRPFDTAGEYPFIVFEFETGANGVALGDYAKSGVVHKLLCWLDVLKRETYWHHLGLPCLYIAFICGGTAREQTVLDMIERYIPAKFRAFFIVKTFKPLGPYLNPNANDYIFSEDYKRVGKPFNLITTQVD